MYIYIKHNRGNEKKNLVLDVYFETNVLEQSAPFVVIHLH